MGDLALDTRIEGSAGRYTAELSPEWAIWGPNGGYLAATALRAAARDAEIQRPAVFSCHFLSVASFETVELEVACVRRGRRSELLRVQMEQGGRPVLFGLLRTAAVVPGLEHDVTRPPEVRPPEALQSWQELFPEGEEPYPFWKNIEGKPCDPEHALAEPGISDPTALQWNRFRPRATFEDPIVDAARQVILLDTMGWPAASRAHPSPAFLAPNLDLCVWFHLADPSAEWLLSEHHGPVASGGLMGTHGRIWNPSGRLLASGGAQLMCVPAPS